MSGFLGKAKEMAGAATEKAGKMASIAGLKLEIRNLESKVLSLKHELGVQTYDALSQNDMAAAQRLFNSCKHSVDEIMCTLHEKSVELAKLNDSPVSEIQVSVPPQSGPGSILEVVTPSGQHVMVRVPEGTPQGGCFRIMAECPSSGYSSATTQQRAAGTQPAQKGDSAAMGGMMVAGVSAMLAADSSGTMLNKATAAAAPHVQNAAKERYSGADGTSKMMADASIAADVGKKLAENPAARAATSALFGAVAKGAVSAMEGKAKR